MQVIRILLSVAMLLFATQAHGLEWVESAEVSELFNKAGVSGTFVLYDVTTQKLIGHDRNRAETRYIPASTFKIPNTLIGLSARAVRDVDEVLPYGGKPQPVKTWEKDMSLREAIAASNAAVYQELARRVGLPRLREGVRKLDYGNTEIGTVVDEFWLEGPLEISAVEQARFLARLAQNQVPYPLEVQATVKELVRLERSGDATLYGKTGWVNVPRPGVGWWVGWVEKGGRVYAFALNLDIRQNTDAPKRIELGKASLQALGVL
jgi:beta-lactamase class D